MRHNTELKTKKTSAVTKSCKITMTAISDGNVYAVDIPGTLKMPQNRRPSSNVMLTLYTFMSEGGKGLSKAIIRSPHLACFPSQTRG